MPLWDTTEETRRRLRVVAVFRRATSVIVSPVFTPFPAVDYSMQLLQNPHPTGVKRSGGTFRQVRPLSVRSCSTDSGGLRAIGLCGPRQAGASVFVC